MSHPAKHAETCASAIGPAGVLARALVGITFIALALLWRDPDSQDAALGLVAMPGVIVGALAARAHRWPHPLRASGPLAHALNAAVIIALFAVPTTAGAAFLFYGTSMLVAAARRQGGCEVTVIANNLLHRDDHIGCPLFLPIDAIEATRRHRRVGALQDTESG